MAKAKNTMNITALTDLHNKAVLALEALEDAMSAEIEMVREGYAKRIWECRTKAASSKAALDAERVRASLAGETDAPLAQGDRIYREEICYGRGGGGGGGFGATYRRTKRIEAIIEVWGPESPRRQGDYYARNTEPGEHVARVLKKDGTPSLSFEVCPYEFRHGGLRWKAYDPEKQAALEAYVDTQRKNKFVGPR